MNCPDVDTVIRTSNSAINWLTDVIIPLVSALIGGIVALVGVYITLSHERNVRKAETSANAEPFFSIFGLYDHGRFSNAQDHVFSFVSGDTYDNTQSHLVANIVNSEKVEFVIDEFCVGGIHYHPYGYERQFISKGLVCTIVINIKTDADLSNVLMYITDINSTKHIYKLKCRNELVIDFEEIQKEV